jgi:hypothetical protein
MTVVRRLIGLSVGGIGRRWAKSVCHSTACKPPPDDRIDERHRQPVQELWPVCLGAGFDLKWMSGIERCNEPSTYRFEQIVPCWEVEVERPLRRARFADDIFNTHVRSVAR